MAWAETAAARANFYSTRDEQIPASRSKESSAAAVSKRPGKWLGGRKQTTAALAEQVQSLTTQMASL